MKYNIIVSMTEKEILEKAEEKMWENLPLSKDNNGYIGEKSQEFNINIDKLFDIINYEKSLLSEDAIRLIHEMYINISSYIRFGYLMGYRDCLIDNNQ